MNFIVCSDGVQLQVEKEVAQLFENFKACCGSKSFDSKSVEMILKFARNVSQIERNGEDFFLNLEIDDIVTGISTADHLGYSAFINAASTYLAKLMKGKSAKELCSMFNIENDFTPLEAEALLLEDAWVDPKMRTSL